MKSWLSGSDGGKTSWMWPWASRADVVCVRRSAAVPHTHFLRKQGLLIRFPSSRPVQFAAYVHAQMFVVLRSVTISLVLFSNLPKNSGPFAASWCWASWRSFLLSGFKGQLEASAVHNSGSTCLNWSELTPVTFSRENFCFSESLFLLTACAGTCVMSSVFGNLNTLDVQERWQCDLSFLSVPKSN